MNPLWLIILTPLSMLAGRPVLRWYLLSEIYKLSYVWRKI